MPRVKRGFTRHRRHVKVLSQVQGHRTTRGHLFRTANQELLKALMYAYRDRRARKREMRSLWIMRINAASRLSGLPYNRFIYGLQKLNIAVDRKMLAELAVSDPHAFASLAAQVKGEPAPVYAAPTTPEKPSRSRTNGAAATATAPTSVTVAPVAAATAEETQPVAEAEEAPAAEAESSES